MNIESVPGIAIGSDYFTQHDMPSLIEQASDGFLNFQHRFVRDGATLRKFHNTQELEDAFFLYPNMFAVVQEQVKEVLNGFEYSRRALDQIKEFSEVTRIPIFWMESWNATKPMTGIIQKQDELCQEYGFISLNNAKIIQAFDHQTPYSFDSLEEYNTMPTVKASYLSAAAASLYIQANLHESADHIKWDKEFELVSKKFPQKMREDVNDFLNRAIIQEQDLEDIASELRWRHR